MSCFFLCPAEKFRICIPRKGIAQPQSQFLHSSVCMSYIYVYSHDRFTYIPAAELTDQKCINRSQKHECRNWDCIRAVPFLGILVSNLRYCVFAVWGGESRTRICPVLFKGTRPRHRIKIFGQKWTILGLNKSLYWFLNFEGASD